MLLMGLTLHLPLILQRLDLLPSWAALNKDVALLLLGSSAIGCLVGGVIYIGKVIPKPIRLPLPGIQALLANDMYTPQLYRSTIILGVASLSRLADWFDRFIVDGVVNLVGVVSLFTGESLRYSNTGQGQFYLLTIALASVAIALFIGWTSLTPFNPF